MAMLAEPRRKQKWSVDPRNSAWSNDDSKFGQKMLEKMGWSKGKGLGAQEQGNPEHVRVQLKNNTLGLGASANHGDDWIAHQDDFNQLLAELNNCHGQDIAEAAPTEEKKAFSLEEKSKTSRKRVHYVKFAKGKDLSNRSEEDLSCIFGKRQTKKRQLDDAKTATLGGTPKEEEEVEEEPPEQVEAGKTVTSTLTVQEYFAKRMAKLKKAQPRVNAGSAAPSSMAAETSAYVEPHPKKKKSCKHSELENDGELEWVDCEKLDSSGGEVGDLKVQKEKEEEKKKKKKKKRKKSKHMSLDHNQCYNESPKSIQETEEVYSRASDAENNDAEVLRSKEKDTKKHKKRSRGIAKGVRRQKNKKGETFQLTQVSGPWTGMEW